LGDQLAGAIEGPDFVAAGNTLAGPQVSARMASAFALRGAPLLEQSI
jgi:uncharacterized Ntn-hydrolase superfamily protein